MTIGWRLVRAGFWLLYHPFAFTYDAVSWIVSMGAWRAWTRAALQFADPTGGRVLELAHGTGNLQLDLSIRGYDAVGCDLSPQMGQIAARKLKRVRVEPRLVRCRAQALPFPDAAFQTVIATFPTDYIVDPRTLSEVRRVLAAAGQLIIVPGAAFTAGGIIRRLLDLAYRLTGQGSGDVEAARHAAGELVARRLHPHGFDAVVHFVPCPRSEALVIVATRRSEAKKDQTDTGS
jgi:ubiquinone/menaquinone biosynthesis C-methylase UbiE